MRVTIFDVYYIFYSHLWFLGTGADSSTVPRYI